jgi:MFS family permease
LNWIVLTALLLASSQAPIGSTLIAVAIPRIAEGLQADVVQATTLLVSSYFIVIVLFQGPAGRLSDRIGHLRTLWIGMGLFGFGSLAGFLGPNLAVLAAARCLAAAGGALVIPSTMALMRILSAPERRGQVFGTFGGTMALAAAIGPVLGGAILRLFDWRAIFLASLPVLLLAGLLLRRVAIPVSGDGKSEPGKAGTVMFDSGRGLLNIDWFGLALLGAALMLVLASAGRGAGEAQLLLLLGGLAAGVGFVCRQWLIADPVVDVKLLRNRVVAGGSAMMGLQNFAMYGLMFQLPAFFEHLRGATPQQVGLALSSMMIGMVVAAPLGGRASDRFGPRTAGLFGALMVLGGAVLLTRLPSFASPAAAMPSLALLGAGFGLSSAPAQSSAMAAVEPARAGRAAGLSSTIRYLGGIAVIAVQALMLGSQEQATAAAHANVAWLYVGTALLALAAASQLPSATRR